MKRIALPIKWTIVLFAILALASLAAIAIAEFTSWSYITCLIISTFSAGTLSIQFAGIYTIIRAIVHWFKEIR
jgi:hypothetical protein